MKLNLETGASTSRPARALLVHLLISATKAIRLLCSHAREMSAQCIRLLLASLALMVLPASAQEAPPANYENWGICPFECCTYREWEADTPMAVHARRSDRSPVIFRIRKGEWVNALTGVVVTVKPGKITLQEAASDGYVEGNDQPALSLKAGESIYMLTPLGEGFYRFWYKGKVYSSGQALRAVPGVEGADARMVWWKKVKNKAGKIGWTRESLFQNVDACG